MTSGNEVQPDYQEELVHFLQKLQNGDFVAAQCRACTFAPGARRRHLDCWLGNWRFFL